MVTWELRAKHMPTTWESHANDIAVTREPRADHIVVMWEPCADHVGVISQGSECTLLPVSQGPRRAAGGGEVAAAARPSCRAFNGTAAPALSDRAACDVRLRTMRRRVLGPDFQGKNLLFSFLHAKSYLFLCRYLFFVLQRNVSVYFLT